MRRLIVLFFLFTGISQTLSAQATQSDWRDEIMHKYWFYRYRLINDFMIVGEGKGKSLPAAIRNFNGIAYNHPNSPEFKETAELMWGDQTVHLGWYFAILATEYALLKAYSFETHPNNLEQTKMELCNALKALERLDLTAENFLYSEYSTSEKALNGFFIRDDVTHDFLCGLDEDSLEVRQCEQNFFSLNAGKTSPDGKVKYSEVSRVYSDALLSSSGKANWNLISQDQVVHLFMGLAFIMEYVPEEEFFLTPAGKKFFLHIHAKEHMKRIGLYLIMNNWKIYYPTNLTGFNFDKRGHFIGETVGGDATFNQWGLNAIISQWTFFPFIASGGKWSLQDNAFKKLDCEPLVKDPVFDKKVVPQHTVTMFYMLCAISNSLQKKYFIKQDNSKLEITAERLLTVSGCFNYEILPFIHSALHGKYYDEGSQLLYEAYGHYIKNLLIEAPCYGPYNFGPRNWTFLGFDKPAEDVYSKYQHVKAFGWKGAGGFYGWDNGFDSYEWSCVNRFLSPYARGLGDNFTYSLKDGKSDRGEYNGLDYMLLYNLYIIYSGTNALPVTGYYNGLSGYFKENYPINGVGTKHDPIRLVGFQDITTLSRIGHNADITYQAGEKLTFTTGFKVHNGARFTAKVDKLNNCEEDGQYYKRDDIMRKSQSLDIKAYPSPATDIINVVVQTLSNEAAVTATLFNSYGQIFFNQSISIEEGECSFSIDCNSFAPGVYILKVTGVGISGQKQILVI